MRTRHPLDILTYKRLRAKTRKVILQAKRDCWQQYCNSVNSNTKLTTVWKALKKFSGNNYNFYMPALKNNDYTAETDHEKANMLADQFHSVSSTANYSIDFLSNRGDLEAILSYHLQRLSSYSCKDYRINLPISKVELRNCTLSSETIAPGGDRLSYTMFEHLPDSSIDILLQLFNNIWKTGQIPQK